MAVPIPLQTYREQIDRLDDRIIALVAKRFIITQKVGLYKAKHDLPSTDMNREREQYKRIDSVAKTYHLEPHIARAVLALFIQLATKNHRRLARTNNTYKRHIT